MKCGLARTFRNIRMYIEDIYPLYTIYNYIEQETEFLSISCIECNSFGFTITRPPWLLIVGWELMYIPYNTDLFYLFILHYYYLCIYYYYLFIYICSPGNYYINIFHIVVFDAFRNMYLLQLHFIFPLHSIYIKLYK